jgi:hypothetical protein
VDLVEEEPIWHGSLAFADELGGRDALEGLQPAPEVVGADDVIEMLAQWF